ncbi:hypothetical protein OG604_46600 [Streptomyces sp. NBC_01231]|nr:hypothetical protein OG604_46600 [Streptomyces sp. NBC_01231]
MMKPMQMMEVMRTLSARALPMPVFLQVPVTNSATSVAYELTVPTASYAW